MNDLSHGGVKVVCHVPCWLVSKTEHAREQRQSSLSFKAASASGVQGHLSTLYWPNQVTRPDQFVRRENNLFLSLRKRKVCIHISSIALIIWLSPITLGFLRPQEVRPCI